jgi:hypothetical protein
MQWTTLFAPEPPSIGHVTVTNKQVYIEKVAVNGSVLARFCATLEATKRPRIPAPSTATARDGF